MARLLTGGVLDAGDRRRTMLRARCDWGSPFLVKRGSGAACTERSYTEGLGLDLQRAAAPVILCSGSTSTKVTPSFLFLLRLLFLHHSSSVLSFLLFSLLFSLSVLSSVLPFRFVFPSLAKTVGEGVVLA